MAYRYIKTVIDFILAFIAVVVTAPISLFIILLIRLTAKETAIFCQQRVGKEGKLFVLYKFRTMKHTQGKKDEKSFANDHVTKIGRFLRRTSLDELPQLVNVLKGDMSMIGPRPVVPQEQELVSLRMKQGVYTVKPGISGWAQINGRDTLSVVEKVQLDREYVDKMSLMFDINCFVKTFLYVLLCKDVKESPTAENVGESLPCTRSSDHSGS